MIRRSRTLLINFGVAVLMAGCTAPDWPLETQVRKDVRGNGQTQQNAAAFRGATAVVVGKGDSVYALSRRHSVSIRAIILANNLQPPFLLRVGQRIVLPRAPSYKVKRGDTLSEVAETQGVGMYELARLNALKAPYTIFVGQQLRLPGSVAARSIAGVQAASGTSNVKTVSVSPNADQLSAKASPPPLRTKPPAWATAPRKPAKEVAQAPFSVRPSKPPRRIPKPAPRTGKGFQWPVQGRVISSFGAKSKGLRNDGINIAAPRGAPVVAVENGVVVYAGNELRGFGNLVLIKHSGGWVSAYAHNDRLAVQRGDKVRKGQRIARVGSTGGVKTPQLHFELRKGKRARDPRKYLRPA